LQVKPCREAKAHERIRVRMSQFWPDRGGGKDLEAPLSLGGEGQGGFANQYGDIPFPGKTLKGKPIP
jgi:hypothetical protein